MVEVALFDAAPRTRMNGHRSEEAGPPVTFDVRRFNAVRGYQAQQGREIGRCLKERRQPRRDLPPVASGGAIVTERAAEVRPRSAAC